MINMKETLMDAENLMKMANQIGAFFESMPNQEEAQAGIANHIKKILGSAYA